MFLSKNNPQNKKFISVADIVMNNSSHKDKTTVKVAICDYGNKKSQCKRLEINKYIKKNINLNKF